MRCAPRRQIPQISCYTKLLTVVKGFSKDLVSVRTSQAIRWKKIVIRLNGSGNPFEKEMLSLRMTQVILLRKPVIRSNGSGYPLEKLSSVRGARVIRWKKIVIRLNGSSHPAVQNNCQPRYCSKSLSPEPFATKIM